MSIDELETAALKLEPKARVRLAERELDDAAQYFEREQPGLGVAFIAEERRCTAAATKHPQASPVVLGSIRPALSAWTALCRCRE